MCVVSHLQGQFWQGFIRHCGLRNSLLLTDVRARSSTPFRELGTPEIY